MRDEQFTTCEALKSGVKSFGFDGLTECRRGVQGGMGHKTLLLWGSRLLGLMA